MSDLLADARRKVEADLTEINLERWRLERALSHLVRHDGGTARSKRRTPAGGRSGAPTRKRKKQARKGQRREEVLTAITAEPGTTAAKVAKNLDINPSQVSTLAKGLLEDKLVTRKGPRYIAKSQGKTKTTEPAVA